MSDSVVRVSWILGVIIHSNLGALIMSWCELHLTLCLKMLSKLWPKTPRGQWSFSMFVIDFHPGVIRFPKAWKRSTLGSSDADGRGFSGGIDSLGREAAFYGSNQVELVPVLVVLLKVCVCGGTKPCKDRERGACTPVVCIASEVMAFMAFPSDVHIVAVYHGVGCWVMGDEDYRESCPFCWKTDQDESDLAATTPSFKMVSASVCSVALNSNLPSPKSFSPGRPSCEMWDLVNCASFHDRIWANNMGWNPTSRSIPVWSMPASRTGTG